MEKGEGWWYLVLLPLFTELMQVTTTHVVYSTRCGHIQSGCCAILTPCVLGKELELLVQH